MGWVEEPIGDRAAGVPPEYLAHMKIWARDDVGDEPVFKLKRLMFNTTGDCALYVHCTDENGAPLPFVGVGEGWEGSDEPMPQGGGPRGGQPEGKPNEGLVKQGNANGMTTFGWGGGDSCDLSAKEGPHWAWICEQQLDGPAFTDVVTSLGWMVVTNHWHVDLWFQRQVKTTPPPPVDGDTAAAINHLADVFAAGITVTVKLTI